MTLAVAIGDSEVRWSDDADAPSHSIQVTRLDGVTAHLELDERQFRELLAAATRFQEMYDSRNMTQQLRRPNGQGTTEDQR